MKLTIRTILAFVVFVVFVVVSAFPAHAIAWHPRAVYLNAQEIRADLDYDATTFGGLAGVDYDPVTDKYVFISNDRSMRQAARYYEAAASVTHLGVGTVHLSRVVPFKQPNGFDYPRMTVSPQAMRVDPWSGNYWWAQEGNRPTTSAGTYVQPFLHQARPADGSYLGEIPLPANYAITSTTGPRRHHGLESFTFANYGQWVTSALEGPPLEDAAAARITVQDRRGIVIAQYAYPLGNAGIAEILAYPNSTTKYLVLERSSSTARLYAVDTSNADATLAKELVTDSSMLVGVEGLAWGPEIGQGWHALIAVTNNGFSHSQASRFMAFAVK